MDAAWAGFESVALLRRGSQQSGDPQGRQSALRILGTRGGSPQGPGRPRDCDKHATLTDRADDQTVNRDDLLQQLSSSKAELARRFGVTGLALFGSVVRDSAYADSDVDILVSFDGPATSARYFGVQFFLEDLLGRRVDLVTDKALRPELRPYVEREAVHV